jgi:uncharacterized protein
MPVDTLPVVWPSSPDARTMMVSFSARNVRSFRDSIEFSLEATPISERGVPRTLPWREDGPRPARILPAAGIFGANASGKTNFLRVLSDMRQLVMTSFRAGGSSRQLEHHPFRLDSDYEQAHSKYEIGLILNGVRFDYGFEIESNHVISEWARRYPRGKAATIFRRDHLHVRVGEDYRAKGRAVSEILRPNSLYLSAAAAADHPGLRPLFNWFDANLWLCEAATRPERWQYTTNIMRNAGYRELLMGMLQAADLGITDAQVRQPPPEMQEHLDRIVKVLLEMDTEQGITSRLSEEGFVGISLSHQGKRGNVELDTAEESLGTLVWLGLIGPVVSALASGTVLLVDELESSLHPTLVRQLVRMFQHPRLNPNGAQLIFSSHEPGLLGNSVNERVLGRDQVWFTEKLHDGGTRLYPLSDLGPRKEEAISRRYLEGRYGATPIISDAEFDALAAMITSDASE